MNLEDYQKEIFQKYKYALIHIGVDFGRQDVQEALETCHNGLEDALKATISYWKWKKETLEYPSAFFIEALKNTWRPYEWHDHWMLDPNFKSLTQKYWEETEISWGRNLRNSLIADVVEDEQRGNYIVFTNGKILKLSIAIKWGWQKVLEYAQTKRGST